MTTELLLRLAGCFQDRGCKRIEAELIEYSPYRWEVKTSVVDLDYPELSLDVVWPIPGVMGNRKARWLAWELGFEVSDSPTCQSREEIRL